MECLNLKPLSGLPGKASYFIDREMVMEQENSDNPSAYARMLAIIRRRRWYFWGLVLIYMPVSVMTLQLTQSYKATGMVIVIWVILLCIVVTLAAIAKCPRCGNNFHMRNSSISFLRKCRYCGLHLCADKHSA
jgi:hypothetical protein